MLVRVEGNEYSAGEGENNHYLPTVYDPPLCLSDNESA
jgi:hypothetical protein